MNFKPGQSLVHRLHPVGKAAWLLWLTVAVFILTPAGAGWRSATLPLFVALGAILLMWASGIAPWRVPGMRLWFFLGAVVLITHALSIPEGRTVAGPVTIEGLMSGVRATGRLLAVILMSALFVATTDPVSLACALMRVGLPYRWGFALVTALRLAPIFKVEAHHIYRAQLVRGVAYDARGPRRWWLMLRHLCLPLLVSALRTAHSLSLSMEGRAFGLHRRRTYTREVTVGRRDVVAGVLLCLSILLAVWSVYARSRGH
jgi:energy-coupling factor transport system permease protein